MNFAFPQFLWALSALSIPIIIHLFNFRKTTRVFFSNTRLLRQVKQETTQKRKLKQYLVLASRLLVLLFLVLAFAQPFLPAKEQITTGKNSVLYLDNSFSMSAQVGEKVRALDAGISFVREIIEVFPADTRYKLVTNDFAPFSNSFKTKAEILDLVSQLRLSPTSRSFEEVRKRMGESLNQADIFWISDLQKSTLDFEKSETVDSVNQWHLVPLAHSKTPNIFIDSVYLDNPFIIGGEKNSIKVRLRNDGLKKVEGLNVKLTINGIQSATASASLEANGISELNFDLGAGMKKRNEAKISFTDFPVSFDNEFFFTLNFTRKINVIEIRANAASTYLEKVYGNQQLFNFRSFRPDNINYSFFNQADLVVINGLNTIDPSTLQALSNYQTEFGSLLVIPGEKPEINIFKTLTKQPSLKVVEDAELTELERPDFLNPFFQNVFEEQTAMLAMPFAKRLLDWGADRSAILKFKSGLPFLTQTGGVFLLASPLGKDFTDFYNHALFVPVMYRLAASGMKAEGKAYYTLGEQIVSVKADSLVGEEPLRLLGSQEIIPPQRRAGDRVYLETPRFTIAPGFYNVTYKNDTLDLIAFNLEKKESLLDQYSGEEAKLLMGGGKNISLFQAESPEAFSKEIKERYLGTPLWKLALILALIFLLAEVLLIRFLK